MNYLLKPTAMRKVITHILPNRLLIIFLLAGIHCIGQPNVKSYALPETKSSGLTQFFFAYNPVFSIEKWKDHAVLYINMNVEGSTAQNMKGSFWYNYRYRGKEYGDQVVGRDVFYPIRIDLLIFHIRVMGPNMNQQLSYTKGWGRKEVGKIPLTAKPEEYSVFIEDLESVDFLGTGPIEKKIESLLAAEKQKEAEDLKKKNEALAATQKAEEEKQKAEALKQKQQEAEKKKQTEAEAKAKQQLTGNSNNTVQKGNGTNNTGTASRNDDDFWETGKKTTTQNNTGNTGSNGNSQPGIDRSKLPEFFRTTDGKYYHKQGDNIQEVSYDDYMALKKQKADQKTAQQSNANKLTPEQQQKTVDDVMAKIKADQQRDQQMWDDVNKKIDLRNKAFAAGAQVNDAKQALRENSNLEGNYQSVEQLMADFNQKMANVNSMTSDLESKRNAQVNAAVDASFYEPELQSYNQGMKLIGTIVNSAKEAKERKEAQARLKAQKDAALAAIKAEEIRLLTGIRTDLFKRFKEGSLPLSSTKVDAQTIYYFVYAYDPQQIGNKQATLYISNVFPISRYSDGTWPFKSSIANDIAKLTPYSEVLHGYYTSQQEAESMRKGMMDIFIKTGGITTGFAYKGKASSSGSKGGPTDFWETGKKAVLTDSTSKEKKPVKKDDFWNN
jgi:hypothetical protein